MGNCMREHSMLILTCRIGETMMIGDDVAVTILGLTSYSVGVGIKVSVHR